MWLLFVKNIQRWYKLLTQSHSLGGGNYSSPHHSDEGDDVDGRLRRCIPSYLCSLQIGFVRLMFLRRPFVIPHKGEGIFIVQEKSKRGHTAEVGAHHVAKKFSCVAPLVRLCVDIFFLSCIFSRKRLGPLDVRNVPRTKKYTKNRKSCFVELKPKQSGS
jgi:hypothetical protein